MKFKTTLFFLLASLVLLSQAAVAQSKADSTEVIELNKAGYQARLTDPEQAIEKGNKALELAEKIGFTNGIAEAYRVRGIGKYYLNQKDEAIQDYLSSLTFYQKAKNPAGEARVYNNIGNLYREIDYDKSLAYFNKALQIAQKLNLKELIAGLHLNIGINSYRKKNFQQALANYEKAYKSFVDLEEPVGITQALQNQGVVYFYLNDLEMAENLLKQANKMAKENELNGSVASINLTLTSVFIATNRFPEAESRLKEGLAYARIVKDEKMEYDYMYTSYELEYKRKNYQQAIHYLRMVYKQDSINYKNNESAKIGLLQEQYRQQEKQKENELIIERQKNSQILFIASTIVAILSFGVIFLLIRSNRRTQKSNQQLTLLNEEVHQQKENLNKINQHLEEIIDERTKDLQIKNLKLSEYSSHLSHQIRGPVATLKGLMILEKDKLIEQDELIEQLNSCISEIDDKIHHINESLNDSKVSKLS